MLRSARIKKDEDRKTPMLMKMVSFALVTPIVFFMFSGGLILSQSAVQQLSDQDGLNFSVILDDPEEPMPEQQTVQMRDGHPLPVRFYGSPDQDRLLVLVHGSGWHGMQFNFLARALSLSAYVVVPDLRGHGLSPTRRGDVDHIGQYEEDLADLIDKIRQQGQEVIMAGHSSGGGLVVRMAGGRYANRMDRAILLAPFLKYSAPTTRGNSGGWAHALTRRIIGLTMLNAVGIRLFNHLEVIQFAMPKVVLDGPLGFSATTSYSYRLNTGYAPRADYLADVAALPPFLLVVGKEDEAFIPEAYMPLMSQVTRQGAYHVVDGVGHLDIVNNAETQKLLRGFLMGE